MRYLLVLTGFLGSSVLQTLCCCVMAAPKDACHTTPETAMAATSCCVMEAPEPEVKRDCDCQNHRQEMKHGVLLVKKQIATIAFFAPIPPRAGLIESPTFFTDFPVDHIRGHGPPPDQARLCRFLN